MTRDNLVENPILGISTIEIVKDQSRPPPPRTLLVVRGMPTRISQKNAPCQRLVGLSLLSESPR